MYHTLLKLSIAELIVAGMGFLDVLNLHGVVVVRVGGAADAADVGSAAQDYKVKRKVAQGRL